MMSYKKREKAPKGWGGKKEHSKKYLAKLT